MHLFGRTLHLFDPGHPLHELLVLVVVPEAEVWRSAFDVPGLMVAAVEPDDGEL